MRIVPHLTMLTMAALIAAAPVCRAEVHARAEILPMEEKDLAKLDKEEVKRKREKREMEDEMSDMSGNQSSQCGTVSIGNSNNGNSGLNGVVPNNTTVIVTGNVFNTASCGH